MKPKSLFSRIRLLFLLSISIPLFFSIIIFSQMYNQQLAENNVTNINNTLTSLTGSIHIYMEELNSIANIPYYNTEILDAMIEINSTANAMGNLADREKPAGREYRVAFLKHMYDSSQIIDTITFYPSNNSDSLSYILSRNADRTDIQSDLSYQSQEWFRLLSQNEETTLFFPQFDPQGNVFAFSYVKTIRDVDTQKHIGYLKIDASADSYMELFHHITVGDSSALCLVYKTDTILYSRTDAAYTPGSRSLQELRHRTPQLSQELCSSVQDTRLQLVYLVSDRELLFHQLRTYGFTFLTILICAFASFLLYQHHTKKIVNTISDIKVSLSHVAEGNLKPIILHPRESELHEIVSSVNHMIRKLDEYINREYKATLMQQEAEYRALQAQINPHFLYNTLNGFIGLNRMNETKLLENSIISLTHLFQYTCNPSTVVSLKDEIRFLQDYLMLQSLKYDQRLYYTIDVEEAAAFAQIPKLLLQPLVENSIIHGLEPADQPMHIWIRGAMVSTPFGSCLYLCITDSGVGFSISDLNEKQRIGLYNIRKRLSLLNHENFFEIISRKGRGTTNVILLTPIVERTE